MQMQEQVNDKLLAVVVNIGKTAGKGSLKLTGEMLSVIIGAVQRKQNGTDRPEAGKVPIKTLTAQGDGTKSIEIQDKDRSLKSFERTARRYNVAFSVMPGTEPGCVTVFFKAKNEDLIMNVFREHSDKELKNRDRMPIMSSIESKAKELRNAPAKIKTMTPTVGER